MNTRQGAVSAAASAVEGLRAFLNAEGERRPQLGAIADEHRPRFVMGVTTYNRSQYLERFVESFFRTRSTDIDWTLIVADDGSRDRSVALLKEMVPPSGVSIIVIASRNVGVAGQTNAILRAASEQPFDLGFKADDDLWFDTPGWDHLYWRAVQESRLPHLVFHDPEYRTPLHAIDSGPLHSSVDALSSMGCFWTFTPRVIETVGYFDEDEFRIRGHAHIDYTMRACRAGLNKSDTLFDARGSENYIRLQSRVGYIQTFDWKSPSAREFFSPEERRRRHEVIMTDGRVFIEYKPFRTDDPTVWMSDPWSKELSGDFGPESDTASVPEALVLSLSRTPARWSDTAGKLARMGLRFERSLGVDGFSSPYFEDWQQYNSDGPQTPTEKKLGRRLLASPGALGYLHSVARAIARARSRRLPSFILFDDDILPHRDAGALLRDAFDELPLRWKLLHLGGRQPKWENPVSYSKSLYRAAEPPLGSYALAIHASAYDKLEEQILLFNSPFDDEPVRSIWRNHPDEVFVAWPPVVLPEVTSSLIRSGRDLEVLAAEAHWNTSDYDLHVETRADNVPASSVVLIQGSESIEDIRRSADGWRHQTAGNFELLVVLNPDHNLPLDKLRDIQLSDGRLTFVVPSNSELTNASRINAALEAAQGNWVIIGSAGLWPSREFLESTIFEAETRGLHVAFPRLAGAEGRVPAVAVAERLARTRPPEAGAAVFLSPQAQRILGFFGAQDFTGGDEVVRRALRAGLKVGMTDAAPGLACSMPDLAMSATLVADRNRTVRAGAFAERTFIDLDRNSVGQPRVHLLPVITD